MTKLLSAARPAINLLDVYNRTPLVNALNKFPQNAKRFAITKTWSLPIRSANTPRAILPRTDPTKNIDCPRAGIQFSVVVQFIWKQFY